MSTRNLWSSDLHFDHKKICEFTVRPWTAEENTERLIEIWNDNVRPGDVCWHLGDFSFKKSNEAGIQHVHGILNRLNGQKRMILGNHDFSRMWSRLMQERTDIISIDKLKEIYIGQKPNKTKLVMCHYPMVTFNQSHRGAIQLHGHEHSRIHNKGKSIDVGLDAAPERIGSYRFWTEEDILEYASKLEIYDPSGRL